jgi:hypothetical protein
VSKLLARFGHWLVQRYDPPSPPEPEQTYEPLAERWRLVFAEGGDMRRTWESLGELRGKAQFMDGADCRGEKP